MEPGHPPRQDPPTEHSHDQVNGSPPRPGSSRGWMHESPLDGGSGWPTSAYAMVPRQPSPPKVEQAPAVEETLEQAQEPPPHRRTWRLVALVVGIIVLLVAVVGGVLATRDRKPAAGQPEPTSRAQAVPDVTAAPTDAQVDATAQQPGQGRSQDVTGGPSSTASAQPASSDPGAVVTSPAQPGVVTDVLRAGSVRLTALIGQPEDTFDFDAGVKQVPGADVASGTLGLTARNGAAFVAWSQPQAPTLADCAAVPIGQWTDRVLLGALLPTAKICVRTSDQRFAWFSPRLGDGTTYLDFTVWKKTGD